MPNLIRHPFATQSPSCRTRFGISLQHKTCHAELDSSSLRNTKSVMPNLIRHPFAAQSPSCRTRFAISLQHKAHHDKPDSPSLCCTKPVMTNQIRHPFAAQNLSCRTRFGISLHHKARHAERCATFARTCYERGFGIYYIPAYGQFLYRHPSQSKKPYSFFRYFSGTLARSFSTILRYSPGYDPGKLEL